MVSDYAVRAAAGEFLAGAVAVGAFLASYLGGLLGGFAGTLVYLAVFLPALYYAFQYVARGVALVVEAALDERGVGGRRQADAGASTPDADGG